MFGGGGIGYLFHMIWLVQYGGSYEKAKFGHNAADGVWMLCVGMVTALVRGAEQGLGCGGKG